MSFKIESVPDAFRSEFRSRPDRWVVDNENNQFLVRTRGGRETETYELNWNGAVIIITRAHHTSTDVPLFTPGSGDPPIYDVKIELLNISLPRGFSVSHDAVLDVVADALITYGYDGRPEQTNSCEVIRTNQIKFEIHDTTPNH